MENIRKPIDPEPKPFQFSLRTLLIGVTIFCMLLGVLIWGVRAVRNQARLSTISGNFRYLSMVLHIYDSVHGHLPPANGIDSTGKAINSWRFQLVPYFESSVPKHDLRAAWNDPVNSQYCNFSVSFFCVPFKSTNVGPRETQVLAITGPGTAFEDGKTYKLADLPEDLIIVVETRNSGFHWMEPGDLGIRTMPRTINAPDGRGIAANIGSRFHVVFADGSVWRLSVDVPFEDVEMFLTINGARQHDRDEVLGDYGTGR